jgi:hypothetical protein
MARILLLIAVAFIAYTAWTRYRKLPPAQMKQYFWQVLGIGVGALLLLLVVTGRLHWIGAAFAALIPLVRRLLPLSVPFLQHHLKRRAARPAGTQGPQQSTVATAILSMTLDHDSGELDGSVIRGPLAGQSLRQLSDAQLLELYAYCCQHDSDSAHLLESYLDQRLGATWRDGSTEAPGQESVSGTQAMGRAEALLVLGLEEGASEEEIVQAHRRLIQKLHPDRGGNDYLASQINRARDILLS